MPLSSHLVMAALLLGIAMCGPSGCGYIHYDNNAQVVHNCGCR